MSSLTASSIRRRLTLTLSLAVAALSASLWTSPQAQACACGCAVFDVGTCTLLPSGEGGTVFVEWDFLNQHVNWSGTSSAPSDDNDDKKIRSNFYLLGGQYMFNSDWGVMLELPYTQRTVLSTDAGPLESTSHSSIGDIRLMGVYSGFSPDMSTGLIFGVKLATGDSTFDGFDPDTEIGSGSTDLLLGGYHTGKLTIDGTWQYFGQVLWQHEIATQHDYRPGSEINGAIGVAYNDWHIGKVGVSPLLQVLGSYRGHDGDLNGDADNTGYTRFLISPGIAFTFDNVKLYADAEIPFYQDMTGNQLSAPVAFKMILSYGF